MLKVCDLIQVLCIYQKSPPYIERTKRILEELLYKQILRIRYKSDETIFCS